MPVNAEITIRSAQRADHASVARLFRELGVDDPFPQPDLWCEQSLPTSLIAERAGGVVGFSYFQLLSGIGYVRNIVSAPESRRSGVGRALMQAMAEHFRAHAASSWCLNVMQGNVAALGLYESLGMRRAYASKALRIRWRAVEQLPADVPNTLHSKIQADDDAELEREFELQTGLLANVRARGTRTLLQTRDRLTGQALGVASFNPTLPGAFPFKVRSLAHCPALLRALVPYALPEHDWLQLVIEDDPALVALLKGAGAWIHHEFLHYRGSLEPAL